MEQMPACGFRWVRLAFSAVIFLVGGVSGIFVDRYALGPVGSVPNGIGVAVPHPETAGTKERGQNAAAQQFSAIVLASSARSLTVALPDMAGSDGKAPIVKLVAAEDAVVKATVPKSQEEIFAEAGIDPTSPVPTRGSKPVDPYKDLPMMLAEFKTDDQIDFTTFDTPVDGATVSAQSITWIAHIQNASAPGSPPEVTTTPR